MMLDVLPRRNSHVHALKAYQLLPSVQADLLFKLGHMAEAQAAFERAAATSQNAHDKKFLLERASACRF
jgi:predicted RNA polymerase sigma factor